MDNILIRPLTKEKLEEYLGYEINNFREEPIIIDGETVSISICLEPISEIKYINIDFVVTPEGMEFKNKI